MRRSHIVVNKQWGVGYGPFSSSGLPCARKVQFSASGIDNGHRHYASDANRRLQRRSIVTGKKFGKDDFFTRSLSPELEALCKGMKQHVIRTTPSLPEEKNVTTPTNLGSARGIAGAREAPGGSIRGKKGNSANMVKSWIPTPPAEPRSEKSGKPEAGMAAPVSATERDSMLEARPDISGHNEGDTFEKWAEDMTGGVMNDTPRGVPRTEAGMERERMEYLVSRAAFSTSGSGHTVLDLWVSLKDSGTRPSREFYENALASLMTHPNHLLRIKLWQDIKKDWIEPTLWQKIYNLLGILRDGQAELAYDTLLDLHFSDLALPDWLYEIFILEFGRRRYLDEARELLAYRKTLNPPPSLNYAYFLLDACSSAFDIKGTRQLWKEVGATQGQEKLIPSDGMVLNVINTAARHGDRELALEALHVLSARKVHLGLHHFEPMIDAYLRADGDVESALRMLCIMELSGLTPGGNSTRSLFTWLRRNPDRIQPAMESLDSLRHRYVVPTAALNVLIEAMCYSGRVPEALSLCLDRARSSFLTPNGNTYRHLLEYNGENAVDANTMCKLALESCRHSSIPRLSPQLFVKIARLALERGHLKVSWKYLMRLHEVHDPVTGTPDELAAYRDTVVDFANRLLDTGGDGSADILTNIRRDPRLAEAVEAVGMARGRNFEFGMER